jgi:hypothetical protein
MIKLVAFGLAAIMAVTFVGSGMATAADVTVKGLVQTQWIAEQHKASTFAARAMRLGASAKLTEKISALIVLEAAKEPNLLDAYVDYTFDPRLSIRSGQFQMPFGLETQSSRFDQEAIESSLIINNLWKNGSSTGYSRDIGVMCTARHKVFELKLAAVNGVGFNYGESGAVFPKWGTDNNSHKDLVGRFGVGIPVFAGLGFSMYQGKWPAGDTLSVPDDIVYVGKDRTAMGFDAYLDAGKILFQMEYIWAEGRVGGQWKDAGDISDPIKYGGYYVIIGYRVTPMIEPIFKYDKYDPNKDADDNSQRDLCLGLNLNFEGKARLQTSYRIRDDESQKEDVENNQLIVQMSGKF